MNKLMGFYELKESSLPTIPWEVYTPEVELDNKILWTIRSAVHRGDDFNLPRAIGKEAKEAKAFADSLYKELGQNGMVIFYPYFVAHKSGTLNVFQDKIVIEAVKKDLWNLVTNQDMDVALIYNSYMELQSYVGKKDFLSEDEQKQLFVNAREIKRIFRDDLIEGRSILLEWSYASKCNVKKESIGEQYLVFYEARTV